MEKLLTKKRSENEKTRCVLLSITVILQSTLSKTDTIGTGLGCPS